MKKIALDARMLGQTGIGTYAENLLKSGIYPVALGDPKKIDDVKCIPYFENHYSIEEQFRLPAKELKKEGVEMLHVPHYNIPILTRIPLAVTIHDITPLMFEPYCKGKFYHYTRFMVKESLKKAKIVFTVSKYSKKDIVRYFPWVDAKKIHVVYNSVSDDFRPKKHAEVEYLYEKFPKLSRSKGILLFVGLQAAHKNLPTLIEAFGKLPRGKYQLVIVGDGSKAEMEAVTSSLPETSEKDDIIFTGRLQGSQIVDFYNLADLFVFPSLYEGFGLPVLEALKCGTAVLCSDTTSLPEVGGDFVTYCNPKDPTDIAEKIKQAIDKPIKPGFKEWAKQFTIEAQAESMRKIFEKYA